MSLSLVDKKAISETLRIKEHTRCSLNEQKHHQCSLRWSDNCAHCDFDYDSLFQKFSEATNSSNESEDELRNKIKEATFKLKELEEIFKSKLRIDDAFLQEDIDMRYNSLQEDLEIMRNRYPGEIDNLVNNMTKQITDEFHEFMSEQRSDVSQMNIKDLKELIETNMLTLQDNFNTLFQLSFKNKTQSNVKKFDFGEIQLHSNRKPLKTKSKSFYLDRFNIIKVKDYDSRYIKGINYLSNGYTSVFYFDGDEDYDLFVIDIYDENWNIFKEAQPLWHLENFGENILSVDHNCELKIMDANFETLTIIKLDEIYCAEHCLKAKVLDENRIVLGVDRICLLILTINDTKITHVSEMGSFFYISKIVELPDAKFATNLTEAITVWDYDGNLLEKIQIGSDPDMNVYSVHWFKKDHLIRIDNDKFELVNYNTGEIVREKNLDNPIMSIGTMPFGFITQEGEDYHTYDHDGNHLGQVVGYNFKIFKYLQHLKGNLYASWNEDLMIFEYTSDYFEPLNETTDHYCAKLTEKKIECYFCQYGYNGIHHETCDRLLFKVEPKRCAFCELGYNKSENDIDKLRLIYLKSLKLFEDAKKDCVEMLQKENNRFKHEVSDKINEHVCFLDKMRTSSSCQIRSYLKGIEKHYETPVKIFNKENENKSLVKFDLVLNQIQKYREMDFYIFLNHENLKIGMQEYFQFSLQQTIWNLPKIYFDPTNYHLLQTISIRNNYTLISIYFTENHLPIVKKDFEDKDDCVEELDIYSSKDGRILLSKKFRINNLRILTMNDKFLIAKGNAYSNTEPNFLVMRLDNFNYEFTNLETIYNAKFLANGNLVLGGNAIHIWNTNVWPFVLILRKQNQATKLCPLSGSYFASYALRQGCLRVWNSEINLINSISLQQKDGLFSGKFEHFKDDFIIIYTTHSETINELKILNYLNGEIMLNLKLAEEIKWSMLTPDQCFLAIRTKKYLVFHNVKGNFLYSTYQLSNYPIKLSKIQKTFTDKRISAMFREERIIDIYDLNTS